MILLLLALYLPDISVSLVIIVLYILKKFVTFFSFPFGELSLNVDFAKHSFLYAAHLSAATAFLQTFYFATVNLVSRAA